LSSGGADGKVLLRLTGRKIFHARAADKLDFHVKFCTILMRLPDFSRTMNQIFRNRPCKKVK
jgi:hypothetical protein